LLSEEKFFELFDEVSQKLWLYILSFIKDRDRAKDVLSDSFLIAHKDYRKLKDEQAFFSWLLTLTRRVIYKSVKKNRAIEGAAEFEIDEFPSQEFNPEAVAELNSLYSALDTLPKEQKEAIILTSIQGFSYDEAAEIQGTSANTVRVRIYRGRQQLKKMLEFSIIEVELLSEVEDNERC
jgi:RNA polymerase sigma-70 factor (ECF subfamily)